MGGRRNGGIYKERASKDRGKEKGNEEMKGRWSACGIGEFENGKSGKKKRGKERKVGDDKTGKGGSGSGGSLHDKSI